MNNLNFIIGKNMNKSIIFILIFHFSLFLYGDEKSAHVKYADELTHSFVRDIEREFGLECVGEGGSMPYDIESISVRFDAYQRATIDQACALEVKITEKLLEAINNNLKIRPYLREYPFTAPRAEVAISFRKLDGTPYTDGIVVGHVFQVRGYIFYDKRAMNGNLSRLGEEPYAAALKIVQNPHLKLRHDFSRRWSEKPEVKKEELTEEEKRFCAKFDAQDPLERWEQVKAIAENDSRKTLSEGIRELIAGVGDMHFEDTLQKIADREKNQQDGEYVEYWDNGQIKIKAAIKNGWAEGHVHGWYQTGCDAFKAYFNEGIKQGVHFAFFPIKSVSPGMNHQRVLRYNEKGQAHGDQDTSYTPISLESFMHYNNGVLDGDMKLYGEHHSGLLEERTYAKGKLIEQKVYPRPKKRPRSKSL
jgi:hypothetical protein